VCVGSGSSVHSASDEVAWPYPLPVAAKHGLAWYEIDMNWLCIALLARVGLARDIHTHRAPNLPQS